MAELHETEVDGVRCFWIDSGRPTLNASLVFRTGMADETFARRGWTHLLEHLCLHARNGGGTLQVNGSVSLLSTSFDAHGPAEQVAEHLSAVSSWLSAPDLSDLDHEVRVLRAEHRTRSRSAVGDALMWRYGARGPGLVAVDEFGLTVVRPDDLRDLATEVFTWSNAVLALDGPPPAGLVLRLAAGTGRSLIPEAIPCETALPAAYLAPALTVSGTTERSVAATLAPYVLERALRDRLRHQDAASYAPWSHYEPVDSRTAVVFAGADVMPEAVSGVTGIAAEQLKRLAEDGPEPAALRDVVAQVAQGMRDPYNAAGFAWRTAHRWLQGHEPETLGAAVAQVESVDGAAIQRAAAQIAGSALIGAPDGADTPPGYVQVARPRGRRNDGAVFRSWNWPADRSRLSINDDELQVHSQDDVHFVKFDQAVGLIKYDNGARTLVAADGWNLTVEPMIWSRGREAAELLDARVPRDLHLRALIDDPYEPPARLPWVRRWWHGLRGLLRTRRVAIVAAVLAGVIFVVALANGSFPGMLASGLFIYSIVKELRAPERQQAATGSGGR